MKQMRPLAATVAIASSIGFACGSEIDDPQQSDTAQELEPFVPSQEVGTLPGALDVSPVGAAGYTIPIEVPAWRGGVQPSLALRYSSDVR